MKLDTPEVCYCYVCDANDAAFVSTPREGERREFSGETFHVALCPTHAEDLAATLRAWLTRPHQEAA